MGTVPFWAICLEAPPILGSGAIAQKGTVPKWAIKKRQRGESRLPDGGEFGLFHGDVLGVAPKAVDVAVAHGVKFSGSWEFNLYGS